MKIVHVIPITRGLGKETLSYFSAEEISAGSIVSVMLRKSTVPALVVHTEELASVKTEVRQAGFYIKKIKKILAPNFFSKEFLESVDAASDYFVGSKGAIIDALTPRAIFEQIESIELSATPKKAVSGTKQRDDVFIIQNEDNLRLEVYRALIRETFAKKSSVFVILPTIQDAKNAYSNLSKGIEQYSHIFHGNLPKKEQVSTWNNIVKEPHPVVVVGTASIFSLPRHDLDTVIVDEEHSRAYKIQRRPYLDIRTFAELFAKKNKIRLIFGDLLLRTETITRYKSGEFGELAPIKWRSQINGKEELIDMREYKVDAHHPFTTLGKKLLSLITETKENNGLLFIFSARRGLSPTTVCGDCGNVVLCEKCSAPVVLHSKNKDQGEAENFFLCHRCGTKRSAAERCKICHSWKLVTLGIGIELVEKEIRTLFPDTNIIRLDRDSVTTEKKAMKLVAEFYNSPGSILIGTEMALSYLQSPIEGSAIVSIDSLFSIPDFRINEKIMSMLLKIRSITSKHFLIQTRDPDRKILHHALSGNLIDFYKNEIEERKSFKYPPFSTLIKISVAGTKEGGLKDMEDVRELVKPHELMIFPAFVEVVKGKHIFHGLLKLVSDTWIDKTLLNMLRNLPPKFSVKVDPDSLL